MIKKYRIFEKKTYKNGSQTYDEYRLILNENLKQSKSNTFTVRDNPFYGVLVGDNAYGTDRSNIFIKISETPTELELDELDPYLKNGYPMVDLPKNKANKKNNWVHRIVAYCFVDKPQDYRSNQEKYHVDHVNANKMDNTPSNLEYVTEGMNNVRALNNNLTSNTAYVQRSMLKEIKKAKSDKEIREIIESYVNELLKP